jgi:hypothetical protein
MTIKRILLALALLLLPVTSSATGTTLYASSDHAVYLPAGQQIISFVQANVLPPPPKNPGTISKVIQQFQVHQNANVGEAMYFSFNSESVLIPGSFPPRWVWGYNVEAVGQNMGVNWDPITSLKAYPGDRITWAWFGPGTANAIAHGAEYIEIYDDNGSGVYPYGTRDLRVDYSGPYVDAFEKPYIEMLADSTWQPLIPANRHNCWGDLPRATQANNLSVQSYTDYYVTVDGVTHYVQFVPSSYQNPAFVNYAGVSIPGCNLTVTPQATGSQISFYGGQ